MTSAISTTKNYSPAPWSYQYSPYTMNETVLATSVSKTGDIPAFEIFDADGVKVFDTNEDSPEMLQEANARLAAAAPKLLLSLLECLQLLADYDESEGEEGEAYRRATGVIGKAIGA